MRQPYRLRRDADAPAVQRAERNLQTLAFFAQPILARHFAIVQDNFDRRRRMLPHFFFVAADAKAFEAWLDEKRGDALPTGIGIGLRENDEDTGHAAVRDPGFCAVEPVHAVSGNAGLKPAPAFDPALDRVARA